MSGGFSASTSETWLENDVSIPPQYLPLYQQYLAQKNLPGNQNLDPATFIASAAAAGHVDTRTWTALGLGQSNLGTTSTNNTYSQNDAAPSRPDAGRALTTKLQLDGSSCHEVFFLLPVQVESINTDAHLQPSHTGARISMALWEKVKTPLLPCKDDATAQAIQAAFPIRVRGITKLNICIEGVTIVIENAMVFEGQTPVESLVLGIDIMHSAGIIWDISMSQICILAGRVQPRQLSSFERLVSCRPTRDMLTAQSAYPNIWSGSAGHASGIASESSWRDRQRGAYQHGSISSSRHDMPRRHDRSPSVGSWSNGSPVSSSRRDRSPHSNRRNRSPISRRDRSIVSSSRRDRSPTMSGRRDRSPVSSSRRDRSPVRRDRSPVTSSRAENTSLSWRDRSPGRDYRHARDPPCYSPPWPSRQQSRSPTRPYSPPSSRPSYQRDTSRTSPRRDSNYARSISPRRDYSHSSISTTRTGHRSPSPTRKRRRSPSPARKNRSSPSSTRKHTCSHKQRSRSSDRKTGSTGSSYKSRYDSKALSKSDDASKPSSNYRSENRNSNYKDVSEDKSSERKSTDLKSNNQSTSRSNSNQSNLQATQTQKDKNANDKSGSGSSTPQVESSIKTEAKSEPDSGNTETTDSKAIPSDGIAPQANEAGECVNKASENPDSLVSDSSKQVVNTGPGKVTRVKVVKKVAKVVAKKKMNSPLTTTVQKRVITVPKGTAKAGLKPGAVRKVVKKIITRVKKPLADNKPEAQPQSTTSDEKNEVKGDDSKETNADEAVADNGEQHATEATISTEDDNISNDHQTASLDLEDISASEGEQEELVEPDLEDVSSASETEMMDNMDLSSNKVLDDVSDTELPMSEDEGRKHSSDAEKEEQETFEIMDQDSGNEETAGDQLLESSDLQLPEDDIQRETAPDDDDVVSNPADSTVEEGSACVSDPVPDGVEPENVPSSPGLKQECSDAEAAVLEEPSSSTSDQECASVFKKEGSVDTPVSLSLIEQAEAEHDVNAGGDAVLTATDVEKAKVELNEGGDADLSVSNDEKAENDEQNNTEQSLGQDNNQKESVPETDDVSVAESVNTTPKTAVKIVAPRKARKSFPRASPGQAKASPKAAVGQRIETITTNTRSQRVRRGVARGKKT